MEVSSDRLDIAIASVIEGIDDVIAKMATIASMVYQNDPRFDWVGFYRTQPDGSLIIGPYQGELGCLTIAKGRGVCGHVAQTKQVIIVPDVHEFAGHIACSNNTKSEMVLPVFNTNAELMAVFDIDSNLADAFNHDDMILIQKILNSAFQKS